MLFRQHSVPRRYTFAVVPRVEMKAQKNGISAQLAIEADDVPVRKYGDPAEVASVRDCRRNSRTT